VQVWVQVWVQVSAQPLAALEPGADRPETRCLPQGRLPLLPPNQQHHQQQVEQQRHLPGQCRRQQLSARPQARLAYPRPEEMGQWQLRQQQLLP
jgi:hypothetical protein